MNVRSVELSLIPRGRNVRIVAHQKKENGWDLEKELAMAIPKMKAILYLPQPTTTLLKSQCSNSFSNLRSFSMKHSEHLVKCKQ